MPNHFTTQQATAAAVDPRLNGIPKYPAFETLMIKQKKICGSELSRQEHEKAELEKISKKTRKQNNKIKELEPKIELSKRIFILLSEVVDQFSQKQYLNFQMEPEKRVNQWICLGRVFGLIIPYCPPHDSSIYGYHKAKRQVERNPQYTDSLGKFIGSVVPLPTHQQMSMDGYPTVSHLVPLPNIAEVLIINQFGDELRMQLAYANRAIDDKTNSSLTSKYCPKQSTPVASPVLPLRTLVRGALPAAVQPVASESDAASLQTVPGKYPSR